MTGDSSGEENVLEPTAVSRRNASDVGAVSPAQNETYHPLAGIARSSDPEDKKYIKNYFDKEQSHQHRMERRWWFTDFAEKILLPALCVICAFGSVGLFVFGALYFVRHHSPQQGALILSGGLVTAVGGFLSYRGLQILKDRATSN